MVFSINLTRSRLTLSKLFCQFVNAIIVALLAFSVANAGPVETFTFKDEATKLRFEILSKELRCPKCQNQNLADSNAKIAVDLRKNLYNLLQEGKSDSEIIDFMVYRYGEFVLYRPQLKKQTYILWFGPAVLILCFALGVVLVLKRRSKIKDDEINLSDEEQQNLNDILDKK